MTEHASRLDIENENTKHSWEFIGEKKYVEFPKLTTTEHMNLGRKVVTLKTTVTSQIRQEGHVQELQ